MTLGLMIAAPRSGAGKTTVTLALAAAWTRAGIAVATAKSGPDYIDPAFHAAATGRPSPNLDTWAMPSQLLDCVTAGAAHGAARVLVEASMGLFDGLDDPAGARGAAADLAARYGLPVLLVLDVVGQSQSAAALARGFVLHDPAVRIAGVVLNRVASARHEQGLRTAMERAGIAVLGALPRDAALALPERHLGLVQASEHADLARRLAVLADAAERHLDLDAIAAACVAVSAQAVDACALPPPGRRIALAADAAFSFVYPHVLDGWRRAGASVVRFSPLAGEPPPDDCDACWLPGGYPELHGEALAAARGFQGGLRAFAATRPVHGECGGYMALGESLEDAHGRTHAMAGLLGHRTSFARRRMNLGYREVTCLADGPLGPAGTVLRGHEFHYASVVDPGPDTPLVRLRDGRGVELGFGGSRRGHVSGGFFHAIATRDGAGA